MMLLTNHASPHKWLWVLLVLASLSFASIIPFEVSPSLVKHRSPSLDSNSLSSNTKNSELDAARKIVQEAIAEASRLNKARLDHPARNRLDLSPCQNRISQLNLLPATSSRLRAALVAVPGKDRVPLGT